MNYWQPVRLSGRGKKLGEDDGLVALHLQEYAAESFTPAEADQANRSALQQAIIAVLADGGHGLHNKSANGYAIKSANRLIPRLCKRRYGRWSGKASLPATFGHRYAPSPVAVPTHAPRLAAVTGLVVGVLSMRNPSRRWYLTTHQSWPDAGRYCRWSH